MKSDPLNIPTLVNTPRLHVRRVLPDDQALLEALFTDPETMRYLGGTWEANDIRETCLEWHQEWGLNNLWYGTILEKAAGTAVGICGFSENTVEGESGLELSWFILPAYQGRGFAVEITAALLKFAFVQVGTERVLAETHPENAPANHILKKCGFQNMGERQHQYDFLPGFDRQVLWGISRQQWSQN